MDIVWQVAPVFGRALEQVLEGLVGVLQGVHLHLAHDTSLHMLASLSRQAGSFTVQLRGPAAGSEQPEIET